MSEPRRPPWLPCFPRSDFEHRLMENAIECFVCMVEADGTIRLRSDDPMEFEGRRVEVQLLHQHEVMYISPLDQVRLTHGAMTFVEGES